MPRSHRHVLAALILIAVSIPACASCSQPANKIEAENCLTGNPDTEWDVSVAGDPTIQGFATDISVNAGQTIFFKVNTDAAAYQLDIYRMGYYQGNGARLVTTVLPSAHLPQTQPACLADATTKLMDCGNWAVSASWAVPASAVSGIYFAHLVRLDTGGDSHIVFVVRDDSSHSDILFQTADETWQAYNDYGGHNFYGTTEFDVADRAFKVSYNRPSDTRRFEAASWVFYAEYPMVRWLEANGYDVTYFTSVDAARSGSLIQNHKAYLSVGHDEYWSGPKRASIEAARDAGVNLAFFSGNEGFWKTRWENSIDGTNTPYRTLVCYKETLAGAVIDPTHIWTGTWADPRFSPPEDGGRPQNAVTGTLFMVNGPGADTLDQSIQVPAADGKMRFWRNTAIANQAAGHTWILPAGTLGYEWDVDGDNGFRPAGLFHLSTATYILTTDSLLDFGAVYGAGTATHNLTLYRAPSGALVFGAGTVQWAFGLDGDHDLPKAVSSNAVATDLNMQQATANLFADMGVQPATLQPGLVPATPSTDAVPPAISIASLSSPLVAGVASTVSGTAADAGGGVVGGVEVSLDGGVTWHPASGRESWSLTIKPPRLGPLTLLARAVDDSGNLSAPASANFTVTGHDCPCTIWGSSTTPGLVDAGDAGAGEYGVRFTADYDGLITGIRFYKATTNVGTHSGHLWSNNGTLLAGATFTGESGSGWQQVSFSTPVAVTANTTYVASYFAPNGHYSADNHYFSSSSDNPPLHAPQDGISGANGVYLYGSHPAFPTQTFASTNYWVDVVYMPTAGIPGVPSSLVLAQNSLNFSAFLGQPNPPSQTINFYNQSTDPLNWTAATNVSWLSVAPGSGLVPGSFAASVNITGLASGAYQGTITLTAAGAANSPVTIPVTLTVSNLLLSDDFSGGTLEGWLFSPLGMASHWSIVNGAVQNSGGGHTQIYTGDSSWTNYSFQADVKLSTLNDWPGGIRGRVNPATGAAYAAWMYPAQGLIRLYRTITWDINAGFTEIGEGAVSFDNTAFHQLKLSFQGSQIQVLYDGNVVVSGTDANYPSGMVALDVSTEVITYDNIKVTAGTASSNSLIAGASNLNFSGTFQGANPAAQNVQLSASGTGALAWTAVSTAPWLSVSSSGGLTPATLQVSVNTSGLAGGSYSGAVRLVSPGAATSTQLINVNLNVIVPPPVIVVSPTQMSFVALSGQPNPPAQALSITNGGFGSLAWSASSNASWLSVAASGNTPSSVNVTVDSTGLAPGTYSGAITISSAGVGNSPQTIPVTFSVLVTGMSENFSDLARGWVISPMGLASGWSVSNGVYSFNGSGFSQSCAGITGWGDYTFDTNIKLANLSNWPGGVRGRVDPNTGAGYAVWLYPGTGKVILYRVPQWDINGPGVTALAQANLSFDTTAFHDLQMEFQGSTISVSWDGQLLMSATDSTYSNGFVCMDADSQPISYSNVRVAAARSAITLNASPANLLFTAVPGTTPAPQLLSVGASLAAVSTWQAVTDQPWLTVTQSSSFTAPGGQPFATATVSVNAAGLAEGTYTGHVLLYAPGTTNSPLLVPVTLAVKTAALSVNPSSPVTLFGASGFNPSRSISITNAGTGSLAWTASVDASWASLSATSGTAPATPTLTFDTTGLAIGSYTGNLTVSSADVGNGPITVPLTLNVGNLLFNDNFNSGSASNWTISPLGHAAGWSVVNGSYTYNGGGHTQSYAGDPTWTDYALNVDVKLASLNDFPGGIRGRVNTTTGASYGVWIYPAEGVLKLFRIGQWNIDADTSLLAQSPTLSMDTNFHTITLGFKGSQIQVYYDGVQVIQATDASYAQGAVALDTSNQPITFDNVVVISQ